MTGAQVEGAASQRTYGAGLSCWTELRATDVTSALSFYTELFGWTARRVDVGRDESYTVMQVGGSATAGVSARSSDEGPGAAAHWRVYTAVTTRPAAIDVSTRNLAEASRDRAPEGPGHWAARKPSGALFAASRVERVVADGETGAPAVIWMDLLEGSLPESAAFCRAFLHEPGAPLDLDDSTVVLGNDEPGTPVTGITMLTAQASALPPWSVGFIVRDCEQTIHRALELGARLAAPAESLAGLGRATALIDPQGATFICWQPQDHAAVVLTTPSRASAVAAAPDRTVSAHAGPSNDVRGTSGGDA